jgi:plastocyanin
MRTKGFGLWIFWALIVASGTICAQSRSSELRLHIVSSQPGARRSVPAVIWLQPTGDTPATPFVSHEHYTLLQKNRTFIPHLQVIPVGSTVQFPNADPFFHNVFSYFDGKRFDLGLYEAGSTKSVVFSREGPSYIFCNIHPEMSAVVLTLSTRLYAVADADDAFVLRDIPPGDYKLHVWIEGVPQSMLDGLGRSLHFARGDKVDLGEVSAPIPRTAATHDNKFGNSYGEDSTSTY